jgi:hypothetical protein
MGFVRRFAEPRLLMTAAMAFFSITVTLNMTGFKLTNIRASDLRPTAIRAYMERQFTVASVPLIRYYDHLRFVYEVEAKMRELRGTVTEGQESAPQQQQQPSQPVAPGESKQAPGQNPSHKDGGSRIELPQQSVEPAIPISGEEIEARLELNDGSQNSTINYGVDTNTLLGIQNGRRHFGGSVNAIQGNAVERNAVERRSTKWIA